MSRLLILLSITASFQTVPLSSNAQNQNIDSYLDTATPWGDPNIQGVWDKRTITPLERPLILILFLILM